MHGRAMGIGQAVIPLLDLAGKKRLLDIGGGPGTYSVLIARAFPQVRCTVLDLPRWRASPKRSFHKRASRTGCRLWPGITTLFLSPPTGMRLFSSACCTRKTRIRSAIFCGELTRRLSPVESSIFWI